MQQHEECAIFDEKRELIYFGYGHVFMIMVATQMPKNARRIRVWPCQEF